MRLQLPVQVFYSIIIFLKMLAYLLNQQPKFIDTVHVNYPSLKFYRNWFIEFLCKFISTF